MQQSKPAEPKPTYRDDYQPPAYRVRQAQLTFELDPVATRGKAKLQFERAAQAEADTPLELDGEQLELKRSEEHTSELQSRGHLVCRLLLEKKKYQNPQQCH